MHTYINYKLVQFSGIFLLNIVLGGCFQHVWPSMTIESKNLGNNPISESVLKYWAIEPGSPLKKDLEGQLLNILDTSVHAKDKAEAFGFVCPNDVLSCSYSGYLTYRLHGMPTENTSKAHRRMDFNIHIKSTQPPKVEVQVNDYSIP